MGCARGRGSRPMSAPALLSLWLRLPGLSPCGHSPSRLRPRPPPAPRCADVTAPRQPMALGNLRPAARPPPFKSGSPRLSEVRVGRPKPGAWPGPGPVVSWGAPASQRWDPDPPCSPRAWGATPPRAEASLIPSSDQTRITPASSLPDSVPTGDGSPRRRSAPPGTSFHPGLNGNERGQPRAGGAEGFCS